MSARQTRYPTLYRIVLDVLPVQASAVPCKRVFLSSKETFTTRRTNLSDEHMEMLQILNMYIDNSGRLGVTETADSDILTSMCSSFCI